MGNTKTWAIMVIVLTTFVTALAQVFLKKGASALGTGTLTFSLVLGLVFYGFGAALFFIALKGGEVSVLVPFLATTYVWVALLGKGVFGESVSLFTWLGIFLVVLGIVLVGKGGTV